MATAGTQVDALTPALGVARRRPVLRAAIHFAARLFALSYLVALIGAICFYRGAFITAVHVDPVLSTYGLVVCTFIISRFVISVFHRPVPDAGIEPRVAVVMPGFNEEEAIRASISAILAVDYPEAKLEVVVVNDGSTDGTLAEMQRAAAESGGRVHVINFPENRGKRAAMAAGIRATTADIIAFVDSDSVLEPDSLRILIQGFADPKVGAIAGRADVLNVRESWLTRMQAVRYYVAFEVLKAAESVFGTVTCCSGCFAAYRRVAIMPHLEKWEHQTFMGRISTFGDDRSLTNYVLRSWRVCYEGRALSHTIVPSDFRTFMVQQLRWKRSWSRESLIISRFIWRKHPIAALSVYAGNILPIVAPLVAARALFWRPLVDGQGLPFLYLLGVYAMALLYGLYYAIRHPHYDSLWVWGVLFVFFYLAFLVWQTYYAFATLHHSTWGTRPSTVGVGGQEPETA